MKTYRYGKKKRKRSKAAVAVILLAVAAAVVFAVIFATDKIIRAAHPMKYEDYVAHYSGQYGLDEYMVYAFIKTESGFDPSAVSGAGARGLMQLMPDTFEWVSFRLGDEDTDFDDMLEPRENIRYGCYLLNYLSERFGGGLTEIAAAYHAGAGCVDGWLEDPEYSENGRLSEIPAPDTAHYVDKITDAYNMYRALYSKN